MRRIEQRQWNIRRKPKEREKKNIQREGCGKKNKRKNEEKTLTVRGKVSFLNFTYTTEIVENLQKKKKRSKQ